MKCKELIAKYPVLYHVTARGAWPSIKENGLLTANDLLGMRDAALSFPVEGRWGRLDDQTCWKPMEEDHNDGVGCAVRQDCVRVSDSDPESSLTAVIRDQEPLGKGTTLEKQLSHQKALRSSTPTLEQWIRRQNDRVFFFPKEEGAVAMADKYRGKNAPQDMIIVCTESLVEVLGDDVELSAYNSGNTRREGKNVVTKNGLEKWHDELFLPIADYNFDHWRRKRRGPKKAVREVTVKGGIRKIAKHVVKVVPTNGTAVGKPLYKSRCHICLPDRICACLSECSR